MSTAKNQAPLENRMAYRGVEFNLSFSEGEGDVASMPTHAGIYAEIHWPTRSLRIGETGNSLRGRNRSHLRWAEKHRAGAHKGKVATREGMIVDLAKKWGAKGIEYYVICDDSKVQNDREFRVDCEKHLHQWARVQTEFRNINTQRGYQTKQLR